MAQEAMPVAAPTSGDSAPWMNLIENTVLELAREDDRCSAQSAEWDSRLADLSSTLRSRIPLLVQQRCEAARHRINCGLIASVEHAWASADAQLFIWDYRRQDPQVLTVPADSPIISLAICPPRPGVFDNSIHLIIVICSRLTVSLVGIHLLGGSEAFQSALVVAGSPATVESGQQQPSTGIRLVPLEGYSARVDGALFHCVRHTADGHIFLAAAAPQMYELAYSRTPGWFHSKCRLVCHTAGLWSLSRSISRVRTFLSISAGLSSRLRIIECASNNYGFAAASQNYVFTVDDYNTIRLFGVRDQAIVAAESVAVIEELAVLTTNELSRQKTALAGAGLASSVITHIFPTLGLDGHLCVHVVTAQEKLFFACSSPPSSANRTYGFDLKYSSSSSSSTGAMAWLGASTGAGGNFAPATMWSKPVTKTSCLDDTVAPCLHAAGVWITAVPVPGSQSSDLHITVRVDSGCGSAEAQDLCKIVRLDSAVLDIIEECKIVPGSSAEAPLEGEPSAFRGTRSFALLLTDAIQVFSLSFKPISVCRPPETAAECCLHFVQLSLPRVGPAVDSSPLTICDWSFDDARTPSFAEQENQLRIKGPLRDLLPGRWFRGLLRFLAIVLRPVWNKPMVVAVSDNGYTLNFTESKVQRLIARLTPVLQSAKHALASYSQTDIGGGDVTLDSVACRSRLYSAHRTKDADCQAQVRQMLRGVTDFADRLQQVLGLMGVILSQRSAYRILHSGILAGAPLDSLLSSPLKNLAANIETLAPVGKLCTAFIIESGLTTPSTELVFDASMFQRRDLGIPDKGSPSSLNTMSRAAQEVCKELEKQCPQILSMVDLDLCYTRALTEGTAVAAATNADVLSRCAQCVPFNATEDRWEVLTSSIRSLAAEDMRRACEICIAKLQQLQQSNGEPARAKTLIEALLSSLNPQPEKESCILLESLLAKTSLLRFAEELSSGSSVPFMHDAILTFVLNSSRLKILVEVLLDSSSANTEAFLKAKCGKDRLAGDLLWKYYSKRSRWSCASDVLAQIAEFSDCALRDRVYYLDLARQAALRNELGSKDVAVERLSNQLDVATRVQIPLWQELLLLASDSRVSSNWRALAEHKSVELKRLQGLQALYQVAVDFGLFHIVLLITDISSSTQAPDVMLSNWAHTFFPPARELPGTRELVASPYSKIPDAPKQHTLFPLLFMRRCETFFPQDESAAMLPETISVHPGDFRARTIRLLEELGGLTKVPSAMWDVRVVATLLEYCNCIWFRSVEFPADAPSNFGSASDEEKLNACAPKEIGIAWVALEVLVGKPFHFTPANIVKYYSDFIEYVPTWMRDLQGRLPGDDKELVLREEELLWHLRRVVLTVIHHWTFRVEESFADKHVVDDFQKAWPLMDGILKDIIDARAPPAARTPSYALSSRDDAKLVRLHASRLSGQGSVVVAPEVAGHESRQEGSGLFSMSLLGKLPS